MTTAACHITNDDDKGSNPDMGALFYHRRYKGFIPTVIESFKNCVSAHMTM